MSSTLTLTDLLPSFWILLFNLSQMVFSSFSYWFTLASELVFIYAYLLCLGGLLCITCTDLKVLCGQHPEVCFRWALRRTLFRVTVSLGRKANILMLKTNFEISKYNSFPLKGKMSHEMAVRILLYSLECHGIVSIILFRRSFFTFFPSKPI